MSEIKLRPWQKEAHHKALNWWADESNSKNFIINAAPGAGKTLCATFIAKTLLDNKFVDQVVVIAPRSEVVKQWTDDFKLVTNRYMDKVTESQIGILDENSDVAATWAALDGLSKHLTKLCRTKKIGGHTLDIGGGHFLCTKYDHVYKFIFNHIGVENFNK